MAIPEELSMDVLSLYRKIILNVAVEIYLQCPLTIISVYIPPDQNISVNDLNNLIKNIQTPSLSQAISMVGAPYGDLKIQTLVRRL